MESSIEATDIVDADRLAKTQALLQMLKPLIEEQSQRHPESWGRHHKSFQRFVEFVDRFAASVAGCELPTNAQQTSRFGALLRSKREAAGLSGAQLAKLAGLTRQTIDNIEQGRVTTVARTTMQLLRSVKQLNLKAGEVSSAIKDELGYNCHIPDSFDTVGMITELAALLNGPGCHIEQTNAYLEHRSAIAYIAESQHPDYVARFRETYPSKALAHRMVIETGPVPFKVIALGPGDGHIEVRFVQHLLRRLQTPEVNLILLDISNPLLTSAHKHAKDVLGERVDTSMVLGNFHDLAQYPQATLLDQKMSSKQKRVYLMMGYTLANLDNEPRFFAHSFSHCTEGDFLIVDFQKRYSHPAATELEIRQSDPALHRPYPEHKEKWLEIPLKTHVRDLISCRFSIELSAAQCPIAGSYMLDNIATVKVRGQPEKRFSMFRHKRYDEAGLTRALARFGWHCLTSIEFGPEKNTVAMLLVKRDAAT